MESVLSSLFVALKAAEVLRAECCGDGAAGLSAVMAAADGIADKENEGSGPAAAAIPAGTEREGSPRRYNIQSDQQTRDGWLKRVEEQAVGTEVAGGAVRECVEKLVSALADLSSLCSSVAASSQQSNQGEPAPEENSTTPIGKALLGDHPNWPEIGSAAKFYAGELRCLCLGSRTNLEGSRLLSRYHETLSSLVRYEMKKVLNLCHCTTDEIQNGTPVPPPRPAAFGLASAGNNSGNGTEGEEGLPLNCCSALAIMAEYNTLQYNSDDPAALVHFAMNKIYANLPAWKGLREAVKDVQEQR